MYRLLRDSYKYYVVVLGIVKNRQDRNRTELQTNPSCKEKRGTKMHSKKLSAKARKATRERMTPEQRDTEDRAKLAFLNMWRVGCGLPELSMAEAYGVA